MPDERLPRVTHILRAAGLIDAAWYTAESAERGTAVHQACQYLDEGSLDFGSLDPRIEGYVRAYDAWRRDSRTEGYDWIESPLADPTGRYRGTPDRILVARPRNVIDIKTGVYQPWHALQLAAYVNMLPGQDSYSYRRTALYLSPDSSYSVREFPKMEYRRDLGVFLSCLNIVIWKEMNHGRSREGT